MTISIDYDIGKYKGSWEPVTSYQQYDVVYINGSLWVANISFQSSGVFNESNWVCAGCVDEPYHYIPTAEQGFDLSLGTGSKLHSLVGGDNSIIENPTASDIIDDTVWGTVSHPHIDAQLRYFEYEILSGGDELMCGIGVNAPNEWVGNVNTESAAYNSGDGLIHRSGILFKIDAEIVSGDVVRVWSRGKRVWFGTHSIVNGYRLSSGDPYLNYKPTVTLSLDGDIKPMVTCYSPSTSVKINTVGNFTHPPLNEARPWDS